MVKEWLRQVPGARRVAQILRRARANILPHEVIFTQVFAKNEWNDPESVSGTGSNLDATRAIRQALPDLWRRYEIADLLDVPCGDFQWMRTIVEHLSGSYVGMDVVNAVIDRSQQLYSSPRISFRRGNLLTTALPRADCIMCRDCLVHFSFRDIKRALRNMASSNATYLLTTTFPEHENRDSITGAYWRPINLQAAPFFFPPPLELLNEECAEIGGSCADKSLGLWDVRRLALLGLSK